MGCGETDCKQQGKMESYGGSPKPLEGQRGLSQSTFISVLSLMYLLTN